MEASWKHEKAEAKILEYLQEFEDVFSKETFDTLPPWKPWDHVIELEPGSKPANCKVYPLSLKEQVELVLCGDYRRPTMELLGPMAVMLEGLGFNLCVAPFLNICVLNLL